MSPEDSLALFLFPLNNLLSHTSLYFNYVLDACSSYQRWQGSSREFVHWGGPQTKTWRRPSLGKGKVQS
jgi:hypothetical protein